tara:strand:- start:8069 stop:8482 length:414 start_codon:yes stop_codon:yes gene_type:complete
MESNNKEIKRRFKEQMTWAGEQLVSCKDLESFELRDAIVNKSIDFASKRLDDGKIKYLHQVPITLQECLDENRNNLAETIEEVIDALIYIIAEEILQTELECEIASRYLNKANAYLYYALFFLMVADMHDSKGKENE